MSVVVSDGSEVAGEQRELQLLTLLRAEGRGGQRLSSHLWHSAQPNSKQVFFVQLWDMATTLTCCMSSGRNALPCRPPSGCWPLPLRTVSSTPPRVSSTCRVLRTARKAHSAHGAQQGWGTQRLQTECRIRLGVICCLQFTVCVSLLQA